MHETKDPFMEVYTAGELKVLGLRLDICNAHTRRAVVFRLSSWFWLYVLPILSRSPHSWSLLTTIRSIPT